MTSGHSYQGKFVNRDNQQLKFKCAESYGQHYFEREMPNGEEAQSLSVSICKTEKGGFVMRRSRYNDGEAPTMRKFWAFDSLDSAVGALSTDVAGEVEYKAAISGHLEAVKKHEAAKAVIETIPEV
jgi:hypothetical protein